MNKIVEKYLSIFIPNSIIHDVFEADEIQFIEYCLCHKEERENYIRDKWGNWDFPYTNFDFSEPYLDVFILKRLKAKGIEKKFFWPNGKKFAVHISHDVDFVSHYEIKQILRGYTKNFKHNFFNPNYHIKFLYESLQSLNTQDKLWCYEKWIEAIMQYNFKSTFYFFVRPNHSSELASYDCDYLLTDVIKFQNKKMTVAEMMKEIRNVGFEIGLHSSYKTYNDTLLMKKQREEIEKHLGKKVISNRQHWLHFDINSTPKTLLDAGIQTDSTLGFNRNIGFRNGTSFPYYLSDSNCNFINVIEIPMIIMDGALFTSNALELNEEYAIKKAIAIIDKVEQVGGCLTINFHPNYIINKSWWNVFKAILEEVHRRDACCVSAQEIKNLVDLL